MRLANIFAANDPNSTVMNFQRLLNAPRRRRYSWRGPEGSGVVAHEELLPAGYVIQPHGFDSVSRSGSPEVVLPTGTAPAPAEKVEALRDRLEEAGFEAGLYDDGPRFEDLAGTSYLQGCSTLKYGTFFVHLELSKDLRSDASKRTKLVETLARSVVNRAPL